MGTLGTLVGTAFLQISSFAIYALQVPIRRLRHLDGVSIHNLDVQGALQFPDGARSFCFSLDWQGEGEGHSAWHHYYSSEQVCA